MSYLIEGPGGTITVTAPVLASLVIRAAEQVDGARVRRGRRRLEIDVSGEDGARVRLELAAHYGVVLPEVARRVQEQVAEALATMCRVQIDAIDVSVEEVE
jgi:uncharacterized alkaline shock family protein YloU